MNFSRIQKNEEALLCYSVIQENYEKYKDQPINKCLDLGEIYLNKGTIVHMMGKLDEARWFYENAKAYSTSINMTRDIEQLLNNLEETLDSRYNSRISNTEEGYYQHEDEQF